MATCKDISTKIIKTQPKIVNWKELNIPIYPKKEHKNQFNNHHHPSLRRANGIGDPRTN